MGREIEAKGFSADDAKRFRERLDRETDLLGQWFSEQRFADDPLVAGFEIEACLIDANGRPAPANEAFLAALADPLVTDELAQFDIELNCPPLPLQSVDLSALVIELEGRLARCRQIASEQGLGVTMMGILPTLTQEMLTLSMASDSNRYRALNAEIRRLRNNRPFKFEIHGADHFAAEHDDIMFEAASTAFQLHLQVPQSKAAAYYNAALIVSAPVLAVAANSPYLFGHDLWDETRVPVFRQAVDVGNPDDPPRYVPFGSGYLKQSMFELFEENRQRFVPLLPELAPTDEAAMEHLMLHNGTIWRWNRPVIGLPVGPEGGSPHLRIEHRALPSGPTVVDMIANAAFFYGLVVALVDEPRHPVWNLAFADAGRNFYQAAEHGLRADFNWADGAVSSRTLITEKLVPLAASGLRQLGVSNEDIKRFMGIIEARAQSGRNGAWWQRAWVEQHGADPEALTCRYTELQIEGRPVHEWPI